VYVAINNMFYHILIFNLNITSETEMMKHKQLSV